MFSGLFEIHITVEPENNYIKLWYFCKIYEFKLLFAVYSNEESINNQYMLSKYSNKDSYDEIIYKMETICDLLEFHKIKIIRKKIEIIGINEFIPQSDNDYLSLKKVYDFSIYYFEFHIKIIGDYYKCLDLIKSYKNCNISVNLCSSSKEIILTVRSYSGFISASKYKNLIFNYLKEKGIKFIDCLQQEFVIYDTNLELDNSWISKL